MPVFRAGDGELTIGGVTVPVTFSDWTFEVTNAGTHTALYTTCGGSGGPAYHDECGGSGGSYSAGPGYYDYANGGWVGGTGSGTAWIAGNTYTLSLDPEAARAQALAAVDATPPQAEALEQLRAQHAAIRAEQEEARRAAEQRAAERRQAVLQAAERAVRLLLSFLTPEQARSYTVDGFFLVTGSDGGRWRIRRDGQQGNVDELTADGQQEAWYCIHPPGCLPDADAHLAQMLHLVTDEEGFRRTANRHQVRFGDGVNVGERRGVLRNVLRAA